MLCSAIWMDLETILLSSTYSSQAKTNAIGYHLCVLWAQSRPSYCDPLDCRPPGSSVHGIFSSNSLGYWSGLPCHPPKDLPHPGIKPASPVSPAFQADSLPAEPSMMPLVCVI